MLRIGDVVRPTRQWYEDYKRMCHPIFFGVLPKDPFYLPTDKDIEDSMSKDVGIVVKIQGGGVEGTPVEVEWIEGNSHPKIRLHNAWWEEGELEVISKKDINNK